MKRRKCNRPIVADGKVHVLLRQCKTCIFRPDSDSELVEARERMTKQALKEDTAIVCHETLSGEECICRGFFSHHWRDVWRLRLAVALQRIKFVAPPKWKI